MSVGGTAAPFAPQRPYGLDIYMRITRFYLVPVHIGTIVLFSLTGCGHYFDVLESGAELV
jgi:hypothetical protein